MGIGLLGVVVVGGWGFGVAAIGCGCGCLVGRGGKNDVLGLVYDGAKESKDLFD
jgi:hypothetical protein